MFTDKLNKYITFNDSNDDSPYTYRDVKKWLGLCRRAIVKRLRLSKPDLKKSTQRYPEGRISESRFQTICVLWAIYELSKHNDVIVTSDSVFAIIEFAYILSKPNDNIILKSSRCPEIQRDKFKTIIDALVYGKLVSVNGDVYMLTEEGHSIVDSIIQDYGWQE